MKHNLITLALVLSLAAEAAPGGQPEGLVSRPAGFVRIEIPAGGQALLSMPFHPFDPSINSVLQDQLCGGTNGSSSDALFKWDPSLPGYIKAMKSREAGTWIRDFESFSESDLTLCQGEGFWILNRNRDNVIFLFGEVILADTNTVTFHPSLNLFGYPYSTAAKIEDTALWQAWSNSDDMIFSDTPFPSNAPDTLEPGKGYWYDRRAESALVWAETRPYPNLFPEKGTPPYVSGMSASEAGVKLEIVCSGTPGEKLDVFSQDLESTNRFDTGQGWTMAKSDIETGGANLIQWVDRVSNVFGRCYLVARADIDADLDGIPDARELFLGQIAAFHASVSPDTAVASSGTVASVSSLLPGTSNATALVSSPIRLHSSRIVYVDRTIGRDSLSGRAPVVIGSDGPKKTIRAGLSEARASDEVVIREGSYAENLNIAGKDVSVRIQGHVNLRASPGGAEQQ